MLHEPGFTEPIEPPGPFFGKKPRGSIGRRYPLLMECPDDEAGCFDPESDLEVHCPGLQQNGKYAHHNQSQLDEDLDDMHEFADTFADEGEEDA